MNTQLKTRNKAPKRRGQPRSADFWQALTCLIFSWLLPRRYCTVKRPWTDIGEDFFKKGCSFLPSWKYLMRFSFWRKKNSHDAPLYSEYAGPGIHWHPSSLASFDGGSVGVTVNPRGEPQGPWWNMQNMHSERVFSSHNFSTVLIVHRSQKINGLVVHVHMLHRDMLHTVLLCRS